MNKDPNSSKYMIRATITANGVVDRSDVVGAVFGQTEGLLGDELDLRDLQKSGRMGRIEVDIRSSKGKSTGEITITSMIDQVETSVFAAALEALFGHKVDRRLAGIDEKGEGCGDACRALRLFRLRVHCSCSLPDRIN